jgi:hypothetical protein
MGWTNSPPTFCAASETAADMANATLHQGVAPAHRLEALASTHDNWALGTGSEQTVHANVNQDGAKPDHLASEASAPTHDNWALGTGSEPTVHASGDPSDHLADRPTHDVWATTITREHTVPHESLIQGDDPMLNLDSKAAAGQMPSCRPDSSNTRARWHTSMCSSTTSSE